MRKKEQEAQPRRVKIGENFGRETQIKNEAAAVCDFANSKIIPAMLELGLPVSLQSVLRYTVSPEAMRTECIEASVKANTPKDATGLLLEIIRDKVEAAFDEAHSIPGAQFRRLADPEVYRLEEEAPGEGVDYRTGYRLMTDADAIREAASVYITDPALLEGYDRHQAAVKAMNDFFKGNAPDAWDRGALTRYFVPDDNGHIKAAQLVDYSKFI